MDLSLSSTDPFSICKHIFLRFSGLSEVMKGECLASCMYFSTSSAMVMV